MKRDLNLVKDLLIAVEACREQWGAELPAIDGFDREAVAHHVSLLVQSGYLSAKDTTTLAERDFAGIHLTWSGHEFLDAIRTEKSWSKIVVALKQSGGSLTYDFIKEIGLKAIKEVTGF